MRAHRAVRGLGILLAAGMAVAGLAACGENGDGGSADGPTGSPVTPTGATGSPPAAAPDTEPPAEDVELFEFVISDGSADPPLQRATVEQGATVRIVVTSDQPDELHLHGYDLAAAVAPGEPGEIEFVADQIGQFELETHGTGDYPAIVLLQLLVQ